MILLVFRCLISAGSPALPPSQIHIQEAIIVHLLEKFPLEKALTLPTGIHAGRFVCCLSVQGKSRSKTTEWRHRKRLERGTIQEHKAPSRGHCKELINSPGHYHYFGNRFCPKNTNLGEIDDWLAARKKESQRRKEVKQ